MKNARAVGQEEEMWIHSDKKFAPGLDDIMAWIVRPVWLAVRVMMKFFNQQ